MTTIVLVWGVLIGGCFFHSRQFRSGFDPIVERFRIQFHYSVLEKKQLKNEKIYKRIPKIETIVEC